MGGVGHNIWFGLVCGPCAACSSLPLCALRKRPPPNVSQRHPSAQLTWQQTKAVSLSCDYAAFQVFDFVSFEDVVSKRLASTILFATRL